MKHTLLICFITLLALKQLQALDFTDFQEQQNSAYENYKQTSEDSFEAYKEAYKEGLKEYKQEILKNWPQSDISSQHRWVQYDENYESKKSVDFENETIALEVIANSEQEAREKLLESFNKLLKEDVKQAYENDHLEQKIDEKLQKSRPKVQSNQKIIADIIDEKNTDNYIEAIKTQALKQVQYQEKRIYKANLKLPPNTTIKKAQLYTNDVKTYAQKNQINEALIFAIIHSESSFNPMARSHIPAYGLMQIVPKSAGVDSYYFLYKKRRLLSSSYLYKPNNNIKIGSTYLHILYFNYLKHITNKQSRLYCAIAAYNTGAGNVARTFIGSNNIKKASKTINTLTPEAVYKHLMRNLPYNETRKYLKKVNDRRFVYMKLLEEKRL